MIVIVISSGLHSIITGSNNSVCKVSWILKSLHSLIRLRSNAVHTFSTLLNNAVQNFGHQRLALFSQSRPFVQAVHGHKGMDNDVQPLLHCIALDSKLMRNALLDFNESFHQAMAAKLLPRKAKCSPASTSRSTSPHRVQKRNSAHRLRSSKALKSAEAVVSQSSNKIPNNPQQIRSCFVLDSASDTEHDTDAQEDDDDDDEDTDDEFTELTNLSGDNLHYTSASVIDRRESHDSRLASDNETYALDDFVVADDDDDDKYDETASEAGSEITLHPEDQALTLLSPAEKKHSTASSDSGLFVTDLDDDPDALLAPPSPETLQTDVEAADVAEQIVDAVCLFSRRCNRGCAPLRVVLSREVFEDREVCEAVECAVEMGVGRVERVWGLDGLVRVVVDGGKKK